MAIRISQISPLGATIQTGEIDAGAVTFSKIATVAVRQISPVGSIIAWHRTFANTPSLPDGWVECNGQVLSDSDSPYNGQTIPDLNASSGTERFLRGASTSGSVGGSETHTHTIPVTGPNFVQGGGQIVINGTVTGNAGTLPSYFEVVWIMRVK